MRGFRAIVCTLCLSLCLVAGSTAAAGGGSCHKYSKKDRKLARVTNNARKRKNLRPLRLDRQISYVAKRHSRAMVGKNSLFHTPSLGSKVTRWKILGENVGYAGSIKTVHRMFMKSASHRGNILKPRYRFIGAGVVKGKGHIWVTVVFEGRKDPGTTLKMPSC